MGGVWGGGEEERKWEGKREREKAERLKGKEITSNVEKGEGNRTFSYGRVSGSKVPEVAKFHRKLRPLIKQFHQYLFDYLIPLHSSLPHKTSHGVNP